MPQKRWNITLSNEKDTKDGIFFLLHFDIIDKKDMMTMRKFVPMLLLLSIATWFTISSMSLGYNPSFGSYAIAEIVTYITLFFPLVLQASILIFSIVAFIRLRSEGFNKNEKINIYGSMIVSGSFVFIFLFLWYTIMTQGLH